MENPPDVAAAAAPQVGAEVAEQGAAAAAVEEAGEAVAPAAGNQEQQQQQQQPQQEQQQQQQQGQPAAAAAAAAVAAGDGAAEPAAAAAEAAPQPAAAALPPLTFSYSPEDQVDLVIKTADGKRIGVHRLIVLRVVGFFKDLLEACAESEVSVPETYAMFKDRLLDLIYDRSVQIPPAAALQVFQLADKYQAPSLMEACRALFNSDAFMLQLRSSDGAELIPGHADWLEVVALASKHGYQELFKKCTNFMLIFCELPSTAGDALTGFVQRAQQLKELRQDHLFDLMVVFARCTKTTAAELRKEREATQKKIEENQRVVEEATKKLTTKSAAYAKLLQKHNRLLAACEKHGVSWHRELDSKQDKKRKRGGQQAQQAQQAGAAAAAAGPIPPLGLGGIGEELLPLLGL